MKHIQLPEENIVRILTNAGVLLTDGHFGLASGHHSDSFIAKTNAGMDVALTEHLAHELAKRFVNERIDVVLVPGTGAISLGFALARQLAVLTGRSTQYAVAMRPAVDNRPLVLKRGFPEVVYGKVVLVAQTQKREAAHSDLMCLAREHRAESIVEMEPLSANLRGHEPFGDVIVVPQHVSDMAERAEVCSDVAIDVVLVEAGHDIAVGHALALQIGEMQGVKPKLVYAERMYGGALQVEHAPEQHNGRLRVLVGEDVVTTGGSLMETVELGNTIGDVVGMAALWNRGAFRDPRLVSLVTRELPSYHPDECPQCADNVPINQQYGRGK